MEENKDELMDDFNISDKGIPISNDIRRLTFGHGRGTLTHWKVDPVTKLPEVNEFNINNTSTRAVLVDQINTNHQLSIGQVTTIPNGQSIIQGTKYLITTKPPTCYNNPAMLINSEDVAKSAQLFHNFARTILLTDSDGLINTDAKLAKEVTPDLLTLPSGIKIGFSNYAKRGFQTYSQLENNTVFRNGNDGATSKILILRDDSTKYNYNLLKSPENERKMAKIWNVKNNNIVTSIKGTIEELKQNGGDIGKRLFRKIPLIEYNATYIAVTFTRGTKDGCLPQGNSLYNTAMQIKTQSWERNYKNEFFVIIDDQFVLNQDSILINNGITGLTRPVGAAAYIVDQTRRFLPMIPDDISEIERAIIAQVDDDNELLDDISKAVRYRTPEIINPYTIIKDIENKPIYQNNIVSPPRASPNVPAPRREQNHYPEIYGSENEEDENDDDNNDQNYQNGEEEENNHVNEEKSMEAQPTPHPQSTARSPSPPPFPNNLSTASFVLIDGSDSNLRDTGLCDIAQLDPEKSDYNIISRHKNYNIVFYDVKRKELNTRFQTKLIGRVPKRKVNELKDDLFDAIRYNGNVICLLSEGVGEYRKQLTLLIGNLNHYLINRNFIRENTFNYQYINKMVKSLNQNVANRTQISEYRWPFLIQFADKFGGNVINVVLFVSEHSSMIMLHFFKKQEDYKLVELVVTMIKQAFYANEDVLFILDPREMEKAHFKDIEQLTFDQYA